MWMSNTNGGFAGYTPQSHLLVQDVTMLKGFSLPGHLMPLIESFVVLIARRSWQA